MRKSLRNDFSDVTYRFGRFVPSAGLSLCTREHGEAVRAGNGNFVSSGFVELLKTKDVDARRLVHEDLCSACAAAHSVAATFFGVLELDADRLENRARIASDSVVARQITGVVEGDAAGLRQFGRNAVFFEQFGDELHMARDREGAAFKLRILVFERVEAVRTGGHNLLEVVLGKRFDVFGRCRLEQVFFAGSSGEFRRGSALHS